jgi:hypothetical protein
MMAHRDNGTLLVPRGGARQRITCRSLANLRPLRSSIEDPHPERISGSFEFRTFWWRGQLAAAGPYWWQDERYDWSERERIDALRVAAEAARRIDITFLVVDVAQLVSGEWIVVECNDAQESGFAGAPRHLLWSRILEIEAECQSD